MATLAQPTELGDFLGETIAEGDKRALSVLSVASSVVRAYVGPSAQEWDDEGIPDGARDVTIDVAARVWLNPGGLERDAIDDVQRGFGQQAHERFYLTAANRMILDALRPRTGGLFTVSVAAAEPPLDTIFVPTGPPPSGYPFPWYDVDDPLAR